MERNPTGNGRCVVRVYGVIGRNGSGKDEVVDYLRDRYGIPKISVGDVVREVADQEGLEPTRENLQEIADRYRSHYGEDCFIKEIVRRIEKRDWQSAGITGIRTPEDVSTLRERYGEGLILIHVRVKDTRVRFQRVRERGEARDPRSYDEFLHQDQREEEVFQLSDSIACADVTIPNNGTLEELHRSIEKALHLKDHRVLPRH